MVQHTASWDHLQAAEAFQGQLGEAQVRATLGGPSGPLGHGDPAPTQGLEHQKTQSPATHRKTTPISSKPQGLQVRKEDALLQLTSGGSRQYEQA